MKTLASGFVLSLALLAGCSNTGALEDARHATGSSTAVASSDFARIYTANTDAGTVSTTTPNSSSVDEIDVGGEPIRIARGGDRVFVTLRADRQVAVLTESEAGLQLVERVDVGAEPYGVVVSEDGDHFYVALSQEDAVKEFDARSLELLRTWKVDHEPRYLALHPSGRTLIVGAGNGAGEVTRIDLTGGGENPTEPVALPEIIRLDQNGEPVTLTARITGDISFAPDGLEIVIPVVYLDNITPVGDPEVDENGTPVTVASDGYGAVSEGIGRFNPAVVVMPTTRKGEVEADNAEAVFVSGLRESRNAENGLLRVRSYPSSATVAPDGLTYLVTMEGSSTVAVVGAIPFDGRDRNTGDIAVSAPMPEFDDEGGFEGGFSQLPFTSILQGGFSERPKALIATDHEGRGLGPVGVVFLEEGSAWVHTNRSRTVANLDYETVFNDVRSNGEHGFDEVFGRRAVLSESPELAAQVLPEDVWRGRDLFFDATNTNMVATGAGVSCASCHFEGRNDGLTWSFASGARQTPSLAGRVSLTEPVTWTSSVESVAHEARITAEARMGGDGIGELQLTQIAAYVDWTRHVDLPDHGLSNASTARGKELFERADVGCAGCHDGDAYTDNLHHDMFGIVGVNTPTLTGIAASAPYLHDGRAGTLHDVLEWSRTGEMGDTSMLNDAEMNDLEAYLRTL